YIRIGCDLTEGTNIKEAFQNLSGTSVACIDFLLTVGWALKENMKFGNKGARKHITKKVLQYLQGFFLAGNLEAADHYSFEDMHANFEDLTRNSELSFEEIPTAKTIKGWIRRYNASFKKEASK
ncbi:8649_t:CDS:2, partial [Cetraspora pellucida]